MVTHPLTYDPVVDGQPLPRVRLLSPLRTPPPGRALVLVPDAGPALTVRPGERVPDARYGVYQGMFLVDTTEHRLLLDLRLAGRDAADSFHCRVELMCQVTDPAVVVARGIRDMSAAWYGPVHEHLRNVSRGYDAGQLREAEAALNAALRDVTGDPAVRLYGARVELLTHGAPFDAPGRSRVRGTRRGRPGEGTRPMAAPEVLRGEVVARKEEPLPPPTPPRPPTPPPPPAPTPKRRVSRVRGTGPAGDGRRGGEGRGSGLAGEERGSGMTGDGRRSGGGRGSGVTGGERRSGEGRGSGVTGGERRSGEGRGSGVTGGERRSGGGRGSGVTGDGRRSGEGRGSAAAEVGRRSGGRWVTGS
ncbi:hypothetical protein ABZ078_10170 [Streptomyces sp. NPDC006385]|uniref:hypothetical protein n=1 Tax=Streptomyces sp. NPDC006385 TaxID=3156761 RepID=UPI0033A7C4B1